MKEVNQRRHVDWWKETRRLTLFSKKNVNITHFYQKRVKFSTTKASYLQRIREYVFWRKKWAAVSFVFIQLKEFKFSMKASHKYHAMEKWRKSIKEDTWIGGRLKANSKEKDRQQHLLSSSNWKRQERERKRDSLRLPSPLPQSIPKCKYNASLSKTSPNFQRWKPLISIVYGKVEEVDQRRYVDWKWWKEIRRHTSFPKKNVNFTHLFQRKRWAAVSFVFVLLKKSKFSTTKAFHKYHAYGQ